MGFHLALLMGLLMAFHLGLLMAFHLGLLIAFHLGFFLAFCTLTFSEQVTHIAFRAADLVPKAEGNNQ